MGLATDGAGEGHFAFRGASGFLSDGSFAILVAQGRQSDGLGEAAIGTDAGHQAFLCAGGFLGEFPAEDVVFHGKGGGGDGFLGFDVVDLVFANGVGLQEAIGVSAQLAGVAIQSHLIHAQCTPSLATGLAGFIYHKAVNLCSGQAIQADFTGHFVLGVSGDNVQVLPVAIVADRRALVACGHGHVVCFRQDFRVQNLQTESATDHGGALRACMHGIPFAHDLGLGQLKGQPFVGFSGAPLTAGIPIEEFISFLARTAAAISNDILDSQLVVPVNFAQGGAFDGDYVAVPLGVGDFYLHTLGSGDLLGQIRLVNPVGVYQGGAQGTTLHGAGGGVARVEQIQHLIDGAVVFHNGRCDVVPLHNRLLVTIGKTLGSNQEAIYGDIGICTGTFGDCDSNMGCTGAFRQLDGGDCFCQVGIFANLRISSSIGRNFCGKGRKRAVPFGIVALHHNGIQDGYIAQIEGGTITAPRAQGTSCQLAGFFGQFVGNFHSCKVLFHPGHELAFGGAFAEIQFGRLPGPVVCIGIAVCFGSFQLRDLTIREIEVVEFGQGLNVQCGHLRASEIQIQQIHAVGQIQIMIAVVFQRQIRQSCTAFQDYSQFRAVVQIDFCKELTPSQIQGGQCIGQLVCGDRCKGRARQIQASEASEEVQAGEIFNGTARQIQVTSKADEICNRGTHLLLKGGPEDRIGNHFFAIGHIRRGRLAT